MMKINLPIKWGVGTIVGASVLILSGCEAPVGSGQVMCWTESVLNSAHNGMAPMQARGVVYAYDPGIVDLICIPIVSRRAAVAGEAGGGAVTPQPPAPQHPTVPAVEGVRLGSGTYTLSTSSDQVAAVPSAVNPGQINTAAETTEANGNLADAIIDGVFNDFGIERSN